MNDTYEAFLSDIGFEIKTKAREARQARDQQARTSEKYSIQFGRAIAYAEVISIMQQYAKALEIPLETLVFMTSILMQNFFRNNVPQP